MTDDYALLEIRNELQGGFESLRAELFSINETLLELVVYLKDEKTEAKG